MSRVAAMTAMAAGAALWPGISGSTANEFNRIYRKQPVSNPAKFAEKSERYYHVVDYATTGHTMLTYFNAAKVDHVCNISQGEIENERPFLFDGLCLTFQDLTAAGARSGSQLDTASIAAATRAEQVRSILQAGLIKVYVGDRPIFEAQDLTHFPSDGGFDVGAASISFASATASSLVPYSNGAPVAGNRFKFDRPWPVLPGKRLKVELLWQTALTIAVAGRIKVELVGRSVAPLNA
jgi:hypothetical protein